MKTHPLYILCILSLSCGYIESVFAMAWQFSPETRKGVVTKIEEMIQDEGIQLKMNSREIENYLFLKANNDPDEYMKMVVMLILHMMDMKCPNRSINWKPFKEFV